jgi:hypothetical protein
VILEVGCGHGSSMFPLLDSFPHLQSYCATDYCENALNLLQTNPRYEHVSTIVSLHVWDITQPPTDLLIDIHPNTMLCIFALSAVVPELHLQCLHNFAKVR